MWWLSLDRCSRHFDNDSEGKMILCHSWEIPRVVVVANDVPGLHLPCLRFQYHHRVASAVDVKRRMIPDWTMQPLGQLLLQTSSHGFVTFSLIFVIVLSQIHNDRRSCFRLMLSLIPADSTGWRFLLMLFCLTRFPFFFFTCTCTRVMCGIIGCTNSWASSSGFGGCPMERVTFPSVEKSCLQVHLMRKSAMVMVGVNATISRRPFHVKHTLCSLILALSDDMACFL